MSAPSTPPELPSRPAASPGVPVSPAGGPPVPPDSGYAPGLTSREFEEVIRRASELAQAESEAPEGDLSESELFRIAREVGLPERHVRTALGQVRGGSARGTAVDRLFGSAVARASRVVPHRREALARMLDTFFVSGELLQGIRRRENYLLYRPSSDWVTAVTRPFRTGRRYHWATARELEVRLEDVGGGRTWLELRVDPGTRSDYLWTAGLVGGGLSLGAGVGVGVLLAASGALVPLAVVGGAAAAGGVLTGTGAVTANANRSKLREVQEELEGVLDELETGRTLEPAAPSWTGWVKKHVRVIGSDW